MAVPEKRLVTNQGNGQGIGEWLGALTKHLRTKLASQQDAEDLAQEACIRLLQEIAKAREIDNPRAYLFRIAQHLLYQHHRQRMRQPSDVDTAVESLAAEGETVEELTLGIVRRQQVNRAVSELSPKCQQVLFLRWRQGLRVKEIAADMSLSSAMVKKYLATGLAHCRKRLQRYASDGMAA